jgi:hypothetical protein
MRAKLVLSIVAVSMTAAMVAPVAAHAVAPDLRVDAVGYVPASYDPAIPEYPRKDHKNWDFGNPDLGGLETIVIENDGDATATVANVTVDGVDLATVLANSCQLAGLACQATPPIEQTWARWLPSAEIPAGGSAVFQLKRTTTPGATTTVGFDAGADSVEAVVPLEGSLLRLGAVYRDGSDLVAIVRNDGTGTATIQGVHVNGDPVSFTSLGGTSVAPRRTGILRIADAGPHEGAYVGLSVFSTQGSATAGLRVYTPFFPIGNWIGGDGWSDPAFLDDARAHHIDTSWGYDWTVPLARQYGFKLIADAVPCAPGQTSDCITKADEDVVAVFAYGDEVEFGHSSQEVMANLDRRRLSSDKPTFVNTASSRVFQVFNTQADVPAMDHYTSGIGLCTITTAQPSSMQGQPVEWAGNYTRQLKLNVEPAPAWTWSQAGNKKNQTCWKGLPTVGEMRAQLFSELANGSKGIMWFIFGSYADVTPKPALWDEAGALGATLVDTRDWITAGDLDPGAYEGGSPDLEVGVVSGPDALVVSVLDLQYRMKPKGYVWSPRDDVHVGVRLPAWMQGDVTVEQVRGGVSTTVPFTRTGDVVHVRIPQVRVGTLLVVRPVG